MSDWWVVVMAAASLGGALGAIGGVVGPVPLVVGLGVVALALVVRRPALLCLGVALLTAALAQRSLAGLVPPPTGPVRAEVTLVADPVPDGRGGVRVDVRLDGRRLAARAHAAAAAALDDRLAGERITVLGTVAPPGPIEQRMLHRHLAGRLQIDAVVGWRPGNTVTQAANGLRRTLARGAEVLPERQRSLLAGLTLGDDRDQPADMTDAFEGAGLTHLLAVSGQNITFALVIFAPLLVRLRFAPRLAATLGVLAGFALLTRFEPSVLRATAMAAVAATGAVLGRPASSLRTLGLGVTGILLVDPLLASSLGFQLSTAGTAGIVVGSAPLQRVLPGPRWCTAPLSVTLAAQAAVAPLLVAAFGPVPLASVPANLLAAPAAGPVMVWGLTGGLLAGLGGGAVATVVHLPTRLLLTWIEGVALTTSRWPLGSLDAAGLLALAAGSITLAAGRALATRAATPAPDAVAPAPDAGEFGAAGSPPPVGGDPRASATRSLARAADSAAGAAGSGVAGSSLSAGGDPSAPGTPRAPGSRAVGAGAGGRLKRSAGAASGSGETAGARGKGRGGGVGWVVQGVGVLVLVGAIARGVVPAGVPRGFDEVDVALGATAWRGGGAVVLVVDGRAVDRYVLSGLREASIQRVDVVVVRSAARTARATVDTLRRRWPGVGVVAPSVGGGPAVEHAVDPPSGATIAIGGLRLAVVGNSGGHLDVRVGPGFGPSRVVPP